MPLFSWMEKDDVEELPPPLPEPSRPEFVSEPILKVTNYNCPRLEFVAKGEPQPRFALSFNNGYIDLSENDWPEQPDEDPLTNPLPSCSAVVNTKMNVKIPTEKPYRLLRQTNKDTYSFIVEFLSCDQSLSGVWRCVANNSLGSDSKLMHIDFVRPVEFVEPPSYEITQPSYEGPTVVTVLIKIRAQNQPFYQWKYGRKVLGQTARRKFSIRLADEPPVECDGVPLNVYAVTMVLIDPQEGDDGGYDCLLRTFPSSIPAVARVQVVASPPKGVPTFFDGPKVIKSNAKNILELINVSRERERRAYVSPILIVNQLEHGTSGVVHLQVGFHTTSTTDVFWKGPNGEVLKEDAKFQMKTFPKGTEGDAQPLQDNEAETSDSPTRICEQFYYAKLTINGMLMSDSGMYSCEIKNLAGTSIAQFPLETMSMKEFVREEVARIKGDEFAATPRKTRKMNVRWREQRARSEM